MCLIENRLNLIENRRNKLIILLTDEAIVTTRLLQNMAKNEPSKYKYLNMNMELSYLLRNIPIKEHPYQVQNLLSQIVTSNSKVILLDNIDVLFDPDLKINIIKSLESISMNKPVIASWFGIKKDGLLIYAKPDHREYHRCSINDNLTIEIGNVNMS